MRYELTDYEWAAIKPMLPNKPRGVRGRPRKRHVPDILSIAAEDMLAGAKWKTVSWRSGTKVG